MGYFLPEREGRGCCLFRAGFFTSAGLDARKGFDGPGYGTAYMLCGGGLRIRLTGLPVTV